LLPALLAIFGRATFWPTNVRPGVSRPTLWGQIAARIVRYPLPTLLLGVILFGGLALFARQYAPSGFTDNGTTSSTSDSAQGTAALQAHFPAAQANPTNILLAFPTPVWQHPERLATAERDMHRAPVFGAVSGPLNPNGTQLSPAQLVRLHARLGPAVRLPLSPPAGASVSPTLYNAYRATAQFISPDGRTVQYYTTLSAGSPETARAMQSIPRVRDAVSAVARSVGAVATGVAGQAAISYDISSAATSDLYRIVPVVLIAIGILLALVLRSLVAPIYLIVSVGLSYLAAIGLAAIVFIDIGGGPGLNFILPFLMFVFLMALGEDYNILVMSRIREEAHHFPLGKAVTQALNATGGTVTSAGLILAGTFGVLGITGSGQIQQIGFSIAAGILLDTFLVRTLLIPSLVVLLGRWNWWPSHLSMDEPEDVQSVPA
jgi:RND superfamily putative drug exporter